TTRNRSASENETVPSSAGSAVGAGGTTSPAGRSTSWRTSAGARTLRRSGTPERRSLMRAAPSPAARHHRGPPSRRAGAAPRSRPNPASQNAPAGTTSSTVVQTRAAAAANAALPGPITGARNAISDASRTPSPAGANSATYPSTYAAANAGAT